MKSRVDHPTHSTLLVARSRAAYGTKGIRQPMRTVDGTLVTNERPSSCNPPSASSFDCSSCLLLHCLPYALILSISPRTLSRLNSISAVIGKSLLEYLLCIDYIHFVSGQGVSLQGLRLTDNVAVHTQVSILSASTFSHHATDVCSRCPLGLSRKQSLLPGHRSKYCAHCNKRQDSPRLQTSCIALTCSLSRCLVPVSDHPVSFNLSPAAW